MMNFPGSCRGSTLWSQFTAGSPCVLTQSQVGADEQQKKKKKKKGSGEGSGGSGRLRCRARSGSAGLTETQLGCFQRLASQHASERIVKIKRCGCWGYHRSLLSTILADYIQPATVETTFPQQSLWGHNAYLKTH